MSAQVAIVGGGIVGLCTALYLRRSGQDVVLFERQGPGEGCSSGSAGMIQTGSVLPLAVPGIVGQLPGMLVNRSGALVIRWQAVPAHWRWFMRFLQQANAPCAAASATSMAALLAEAAVAYDPLLEAARCTELRAPRGELYVYGDRAKFEATAASKFAAYREHGVPFQELHGPALHDFEPALSAGYQHGYYVSESQYVKDPLRLCQALARSLADGGGEVALASVAAIRRLPGGRAAVVTPWGERSFDAIVIANGASATGLAATLDVQLPILPMRGYHVMVDGESTPLRGPVISGEMNVAATPMLGGIRLAGTLEFVKDEDMLPDWRRAEMLLPLCRTMLPSLPAESRGRWFGHRPGTPDSLPFIGPLPGALGVWVAAGHGMLGLTLAAITGRLVAEGLLAGRPMAALAPFAVDRFSPPWRDVAAA